MEKVKVIHAEMLANGRPERVPFETYPGWLDSACKDLRVKLSERGARDYAVADVLTATGWQEAAPGCFITHDADGYLGVESA